MKKPILLPELSEDENKAYDDKAAHLAKELNVSKVHVVVQIDKETFERTVCYLKEPNYPTKINVLNKASQLGAWAAGDELREASVIKESSDARTYGESAECDAYKLGITEYCMGMVTRMTNQFKKK